MVIKASSAGEIRRLVEALGSGDEVRREAAIARLSVLGARAVDRLVAAYRTARDCETRVAVLRALEPAAAPRSLPLARQAMARGGDEAIAGTSVLSRLLESPDREAAVTALDALMSLAMDSTAERRVRLAAFDAMQELPSEVRNRVIAFLEADGTMPTGADSPAAATWADALEGRLPGDPAVLREAIDLRAASAPLGEIQKLIDGIRTREQGVRGTSKRAAWQAARGSLHQALSLRGSRIALYDLRETIERASAPLPPSFLAALSVVGDPSCLGPIAAAHAAAASDSPWRRQLAVAFHAIVKRERITRRSAVLKRIAARWPEILQ